MATLAEMYIKMMLEDGVFHADPHAGNLLVDAAGPAGAARLRDGAPGGAGDPAPAGRGRPRRRPAGRGRPDQRLLRARDPGSRRGPGHGAGRGAEPDGDHDPRRRLVPADPAAGGAGAPDLLRVAAGAARRTWSTSAARRCWSRGSGSATTPTSTPSPTARPVVARSATRLIQGVLEQDPRARITDWTQEAIAAVRTVRDLVRRVERDELRVRSHPRDVLELQRFLAQQVRRALLALFAFTVARHHQRAVPRDPPARHPGAGAAALVRDVPGDLPAARPPVPEPAPLPPQVAGRRDEPSVR